MKMSEVFERAAEIVDSGKEPLSCFAIDMASNFDKSLARGWYRENILCGLNRPSETFRASYETEEFIVHHRVMALCFAATIAESEGL